MSWMLLVCVASYGKGCLTPQKLPPCFVVLGPWVAHEGVVVVEVPEGKVDELVFDCFFGGGWGKMSVNYRISFRVEELTVDADRSTVVYSHITLHVLGVFNGPVCANGDHKEVYNGNRAVSRDGGIVDPPEKTPPLSASFMVPVFVT